ncbi:DUF3822 family protein [uncultured Dokdonia sp.]|uniref:DUF3822 family protein n=1 Tax=uncultured Dokdonia sp. TaxID=575653 RepID=UPI0026127185|nr:DUF3822 family protein [uncultured Dokdonia sp.]
MTNNNQSHTISKKLSIQVCLDGLSFFTQDIASKEVIMYKAITFEQKVDPAALLGEVTTIFNTHSALQESYAKVEVIYTNHLFTLVPKDVFDPTKLTDYLKFNTKILATDFIAYDSIETQDIVIVYIPYTNINNFFFDTFGAFDYYHGISLFIKETLEKEPLSEDPKVHIHVHKNSFDLIVTQKKKLILANTFDFYSKEDFMYYTLFTLEQLELNPDTIQVFLTGDIQKDSPLFELAYTYIRHLNIKENPASVIPTTDYILSSLL